MPRNLTDIQNFLFDMDGTLYLGPRVFPGTIELLSGLRKQGKRFLLLTNNSSKSVPEYREHLAQLGIDVTEDEIFTSATATILYLHQRRPGARLFLLAAPGVTEEFRRAGFQIVDDQPEFVVLTFDRTLTYEKLRKACGMILRGATFVATHPDLVCPTDEGPIPDCGSMIRLITAATGTEPKIPGKPNREMIEFALARLNAQPQSTAIVGDRLYTDMKMGVNAGLTTILVLTGETTREAVDREPQPPDYIVESVADLAKLLGG